MTTTPQVRRALKPLAMRNADAKIVGRFLVLSPVRHIFRAVMIGRTSQAIIFEPRWCVMHLFEVRTRFFFNWGNFQMPPYLFHPEKGLWKWDRPGVVEALRGVIEIEALPKLRSIETIEDLVRHLEQRSAGEGGTAANYLWGWPMTQLHFEIARGRLDGARALCREHVDPRDIPTYGRDEEDKAELRRCQHLSSLLKADDRAGLAAALHAYEGETVRNLKIEHFWEPTPFPLELGS